MRLRTFVAANMSEAIEQVRRELGSDAIIVSSFSTDAGKIEITAAVESSRPNTAEENPAGSLPDLEASLEQLLRSRLRADRPIHPASPAPAHSGIAFDESVIAEALDAQGLPAELRDALVHGAAALKQDDAVAALAAALETRFGFEPVAVLPATPIMLIGLPGAGKTVTMAKLAANAVLEGLSVDLISTDTERVGAFAQSEAYAKLLELGVRPARDVDTLSLLLDENAARINRSPDRPGKPCFIDTASVNPFDRTEFSNLKRLIDGARVSAGTEPVIVVSATGDTSLLCEVAGTFAQFGARRLIATQVDISRRIGPVLAAADASHLAIAQISVTPYLARGLARMNSFVCARLILGSHDRRAEETPISAAS